MSPHIRSTTGSTVRSISAQLTDAEWMADADGTQFLPTSLSASWFRSLGKPWALSQVIATGHNAELKTVQMRWTDIKEVPEWVRAWMWIYSDGIEVYGFESDHEEQW